MHIQYITPFHVENNEPVVWIGKNNIEYRLIIIEASCWNSLLKKDKYNLNYRISGDYEFLLRILNKDLKITYIKKRICKMRIGGDSTNFKNIFFKLNEDFRIANKYFNFPLITIFFKMIQKVNQFKIF